jgi:hypothetical protein
MERLGPVGMIRFLQQFETGAVDYTAERESWLTETDLDTLATKIQQQRPIDDTNIDQARED